MKPDRLKHLAINEEGFIFDPVTGESFTVNETGIAGLKGLKQGKSVEEIAALLTEEFEVTPEEAEYDLNDFIDQLQTYNLF